MLFPRARSGQTKLLGRKVKGIFSTTRNCSFLRSAQQFLIRNHKKIINILGADKLQFHYIRKSATDVFHDVIVRAGKTHPISTADESIAKNAT
ncbi:hypothetical protein OX89_04090 [Diaphorobacter sp. J5-51]|nr:hypothetical protein OX89_04090 [Diaphorobacter sp. J5-51]